MLLRRGVESRCCCGVASCPGNVRSISLSPCQVGRRRERSRRRRLHRKASKNREAPKSEPDRPEWRLCRSNSCGRRSWTDDVRTHRHRSCDRARCRAALWNGTAASQRRTLGPGQTGARPMIRGDDRLTQSKKNRCNRRAKIVDLGRFQAVITLDAMLAKSTSLPSSHRTLLALGSSDFAFRLKLRVPCSGALLKLLDKPLPGVQYARRRLNWPSSARCDAASPSEHQGLEVGFEGRHASRISITISSPRPAGLARLEKKRETHEVVD
jgi:hypothetical protein